MYWIDFGKGMEEGYETLDKTRKAAIAYMGFKNSVRFADGKAPTCMIYHTKNKNSYVGRISFKHQRYWWVSYSMIQELNENGQVKKLLTYALGL